MFENSLDFQVKAHNFILVVHCKSLHIL